MLPVWHLGKSPSNMIARRDPIACRADAPRRDSIAALSLSEIGFPSYFRAEGIIHSRNECPLMGTMNFSACSSPGDTSGNSVVHPSHGSGIRLTSWAGAVSATSGLWWS